MTGVALRTMGIEEEFHLVDLETGRLTDRAPELLAESSDSYDASLSPDATAFAHLVDDGGYLRAVQRFLRGWRASSSREVELPVEGPVTRVIHSADGHWLACEVAPHRDTGTQIWLVTTDPAALSYG